MNHVATELRLFDAAREIEAARQDVITASIVLREVIETVDALYTEPKIHTLSMPARLKLDTMKERAEFALGKLK